MGKHDDCTYEICGLAHSYWGYRPSYGANIAFTVLFGISLLLFLAQSVFSKRWFWFTFAMVFGCALEVIGYIGRVLAYDDVFGEVCSSLLHHMFSQPTLNDENCS